MAAPWSLILADLRRQRTHPYGCALRLQARGAGRLAHDVALALDHALKEFGG